MSERCCYWHHYTCAVDFGNGPPSPCCPSCPAYPNPHPKLEFPEGGESDGK